jgi:hypothetical protein
MANSFSIAPVRYQDVFDNTADATPLPATHNVSVFFKCLFKFLLTSIIISRNVGPVQAEDRAQALSLNLEPPAFPDTDFGPMDFEDDAPNVSNVCHSPDGYLFSNKCYDRGRWQ